MSNLEKLHLQFPIIGNQEFIDGNDLNEIIKCLTQLKKFEFNFLSDIRCDNQINLISKESIENTFTNWKFSEVVCSVDYFPEELESQCRIYSYPYRWREYNNITNAFSGGLFHCVREISLFDERPFEHRFFLRIAQSFPLIEFLRLRNEKHQQNKQSRKSSNKNEHFPRIHYPRLQRLFLFESHEDYYEEFLLDNLIVLPHTVHLSVDYQRLKKITNNFRRNAMKINCSKIHCLSIGEVSRCSKYFEQYFPRAHIIRY